MFRIRRNNSDHGNNCFFGRFSKLKRGSSFSAEMAYQFEYEIDRENIR